MVEWPRMEMVERERWIEIRLWKMKRIVVR